MNLGEYCEGHSEPLPILIIDVGGHDAGHCNQWKMATNKKSMSR